jgi:poly-gamma-glutamate capsule biosynthesis protein CapA/YwtB (metallophosphatase superfamily)
LPYSELTLSITKLDQYFEPHLHCGSLRLHARAKVDGRIRETPITELRRFVGSGFRAAITEQFGLPYLFGSGRLTDGTNTGPETNLGADCANFIVFALRREGRRIPWSDPKGLRAQLDRIGSSLHPGEARLTTSNLQRGMIVDLGTHVAAVMVDRSPLGVLDENDLVAHQLKGIPELLALGELLRNRKKDSFDLLQPPAATSTTLLFGGDVMLGRSFTKKIMDGIDPFSGIQSLLSSCSFAVANLESTISELGSSTESKKYSFRAPPISAKSLARAGFRVMGLANNHALDFGQQAASDCISNLAQEKIESVGIGSTIDQASLPKIFTLPNENKIGLLAIDDLGSKGVPGAELAMGSDRMRLKDAITKAREQANFVVCLVHWGIENTSVVTERQRELGRWLIREGVDAVIGSHPHCLQPLDFYHGCPIAYSLGNLVFDGAPTVASWNRSALLEIGLKEGGNVSLVRSISIVLKEGLPQIPADHKNALWSSDHSGPGVAVDQGP